VMCLPESQCAATCAYTDGLCIQNLKI
jgi:hypothetical protein